MRTEQPYNGMGTSCLDKRCNVRFARNGYDLVYRAPCTAFFKDVCALHDPEDAMHSASMAPPPSRAVLPADGFEEPIIIHPVLLRLVAQDGNPAGTHKGQRENLPLLVGNSSTREV